MFLIQHGYGKSQKIETVANEVDIRGVILSPADENAENIRKSAQQFQESHLDVFLDPQTYVYGPEPVGVGKHHASHGLQFKELTWHPSPKMLIACVEAVRKANENAGINDLWIAPTAFQHTFDDQWAAVSLQLAAAASEDWGAEKTILSVSISAGALGSWETMQDWLDAVTSIDATGVYLTIDRSLGGYPPTAWHTGQLTNLLRLIYSLSQLNDYQVTLGYGDLDGLVTMGAGTNSFASGWYHGLRQFRREKWVPNEQSGGSQPNPRMFLGNLWATPLVESEIQPIYNNSSKHNILTAYDLAILDEHGTQGWPIRETQERYLKSLAIKANEISQFASINDRADMIGASLASAVESFDVLERLNVAVSPPYRARAVSLLDSLNAFREAEGV